MLALASPHGEATRPSNHVEVRALLGREGKKAEAKNLYIQSKQRKLLNE